MQKALNQNFNQQYVREDYSVSIVSDQNNINDNQHRKSLPSAQRHSNATTE
jgi:hypothetical protein